MTDMTPEQALIKELRFWRSERPDEWKMDEIIRLAEKALSAPRVPDGWNDDVADAGKMVAELDRIRGLIAQAPIDSLGTGHNDGACPPWPIRDEVVDGLSRMIRTLTAAPSPDHIPDAGEMVESDEVRALKTEVEALREYAREHLGIIKDVKTWDIEQASMHFRKTGEACRVVIDHRLRKRIQEAIEAARLREGEKG